MESMNPAFASLSILDLAKQHASFISASTSSARTRISTQAVSGCYGPSNGITVASSTSGSSRYLNKGQNKPSASILCTEKPLPSTPHEVNTSSTSSAKSPVRKLSWTRLWKRKSKKSESSNSSSSSSSNSGFSFPKIPVVLKSLVKRAPKGTTPVYVEEIATPDSIEPSSSSVTSSGSEESAILVSSPSSNSSTFSFVHVNLPTPPNPAPICPPPSVLQPPVLCRLPSQGQIATPDASGSNQLVPRPAARIRAVIPSSQRRAIAHYPRVAPELATRPEQVWPTMTTTELVENKLMKRIGVIGQGAQGWVALWKAAGTGQLVAVKGCSVPAGPQADLVKIKVEEEKVVKALMNERGEWPATIAVFHSTIFVKTTNELLQIGEYVHGLSMIQAVRNFTPKAMKAFLHQVCQGLKYIHSRGVIHRDIKAENLMIDADGMVKIIDFGLAVLTTADEAERSLYAGTPGFIAPEIEESRPCTTAADIWSLGICAVELLTGRIPQDSRDMTARELPDSLPWSLREFLFFCFVEDPAYRPSADGLLAHEFLQGPIENEELIKVYIEDQPELEAPVGKPTRMAKFKQGMHKHVLRK